MKLAGNIAVVVVVLVVVLGLVLGIGLLQPTRNGVVVNPNLTLDDLSPEVRVDSVFWSFTGQAAQNFNVCMNKSRTAVSEFTLIGLSNISLDKFDGCQVRLNGNQADSELRSLESQIKISASAYTHFSNTAQLCCGYKGQQYCSQTANLTLCQLSIEEVELPTGRVQGCNYDSDCIDLDYCEETFGGFAPSNCGDPYDKCSADRHCECKCRVVSYDI